MNSRRVFFWKLIYSFLLVLLGPKLTSKIWGKPLREFGKFTIPITKIKFPTLFAADLINVQPMQEPIGTIFYMNYTPSKDSTLDKGFNRTFEEKQYDWLNQKD